MFPDLKDREAVNFCVTRSRTSTRPSNSCRRLKVYALPGRLSFTLGLQRSAVLHLVCEFAKRTN